MAPKAAELYKREVAARLKILDALLEAIRRRKEVVEILAASSNRNEAARALQGLLKIDAEASFGVVGLRFEHLVADELALIEDEADSYRRSLND